MTADTRELHERIRQENHQRSPLSHPLDFVRVMSEYRKDGQYMLRRFGVRSWYTFWYSKLFVGDEGGEYDLRVSLYKRFPFLAGKPFKIEIEHSTVCNKKCVFCMHTHWQEKQQQMPLENYKLLIDSVPSLKWLNIAGIGSAFLHRDFIRMIEYARGKHINVNFVDEFDFFDREKAARIIELGVNSVYISFDAATKETYEFMKKGCDYDRAIGNIRTLLALKKEMNSPFPVVHFRYLVTRLNYTEMPRYIEMIAGLENRGSRARVEFIGMIKFHSIEDYYMPLHEIPDDILRETFENALKHKINLYFSHSDEGTLPSMSDCVRWTEPFVLVDGHIISDCAILMQSRRDFLRKHSFGNVFETPFMDIWNSDRYRAFRKQVVTGTAKVPASCVPCCAFDTLRRKELFGVEEGGDF